jgi:hypothetical protein
MELGENKGIKVLRAGQSWHGGTHVWSLPQAQPDGTVTPGDWTPAVKPAVCSRGWHLTTEPARWWGVDAGIKAYLAEWDGAVGRREGDDKFAVERCRLVRELTADELAALNVFLSGEHEVRPGVAWAYGSSTVRASGSSTVMASGSSTVRASGSSTVTACDSSTVTACDSSTVTAYDSSTVMASGSSTVTACDSSTVMASGSSKTHAAGRSTATAWSGTTVVTRADEGCIVDRRGPAPKTYLKRAGLDGWRFVDGTWVQRAKKAVRP